MTAPVGSLIVRDNELTYMLKMSPGLQDAEILGSFLDDCKIEFHCAQGYRVPIYFDPILQRAFDNNINFCLELRREVPDDRIFATGRTHN